MSLEEQKLKHSRLVANALQMQIALDPALTAESDDEAVLRASCDSIKKLIAEKGIPPQGAGEPAPDATAAPGADDVDESQKPKPPKAPAKKKSAAKKAAVTNAKSNSGSGATASTTKEKPVAKKAVKTTGAKKASSAKKSPAKKAAKKSKAGAKAGSKRAANFPPEAKISVTVDGNPRREGTTKHTDFALIRKYNGKTVKAYIDAGGRQRYLQSLVRRGWGKVA